MCSVALIRLILIVFYTAVLGSVAIVFSLMVPGGSTFTPLARIWSRLILGTCRVRVRVAGAAGVDTARSCVYIANHQSLFDIPALIVALPTGFRMTPKRGLLYVPIFGWALWLGGFIFIDRKNRAKAIRSLDRAALQVAHGRPIVIFAEGTRSPDGNLLPFKKGGFILALKAGVPVVPVSILGGREVLPKGSLRIRPGTIAVTLGAPIGTGDYTLETKDDLIERTRSSITAGLVRQSAAAESRPLGAG